jgi:hypothetical protein
MIFNAMGRVLSSSACSGASGRAARECVTGARLLAELKATQLYGYTGRLELDANGDRLERYVVSQVNIFVLFLCFAITPSDSYQYSCCYLRRRTLTSAPGPVF